MTVVAGILKSVGSVWQRVQTVSTVSLPGLTGQRERGTSSGFTGYRYLDVLEIGKFFHDG